MASSHGEFPSDEEDDDYSEAFDLLFGAQVPAKVIITARNDFQLGVKPLPLVQYDHLYNMRLSCLSQVIKSRVSVSLPNLPIIKITDLLVDSAREVKDSEKRSSFWTTFPSVPYTTGKMQTLETLKDTVVIIGSILKWTQDHAIAEIRTKHIHHKQSLTKVAGVYLEDETTKVRLTFNDARLASGLVNGVVCGAVGRITNDGSFAVGKLIFASAIPHPVEDFKHSLKMVFVSSVMFESSENVHCATVKLFNVLKMYARKKQGLDRMLVFFVGNTLNTKVGFWKTHAENAKVLDELLYELCQVAEVYIIPGDSDPVGALLPIQQIHRCVFPHSHTMKSFHRLTNPARLDFNIPECSPFDMLVSSGESVADIINTSALKSAIHACTKSLQWGHLCPTAPNTLGIHPGVVNDPFIIKNAPKIFVSGSKGEKFEMVNYENTECWVLPAFINTSRIVLVEKDLNPVVILV